MRNLTLRDSLAGLFGIHCLAATLWSVDCARAADSPQESSHAFKVSIVSKLEAMVEHETQKVDADTQIAYTWQCRGRERVLRFDSIQVKVAVDDKETVNQFMSRARYSTPKQGQANDGPGQPVADPLKKMLEASFGVPVLALELDESGKELKRTVLLDPAKKSLIHNSQIVTAQFFHPAFFPDRQEWQADGELSLGNNNVAKGKLTYAKGPSGKDGQATRVSGTLTNAGVKSPDGSPDIKDVRYVVRGEQTYDPVQREWASGQLSIDVSYQLTEDDRPLGSASGKMVLDFEMLPAKDAAELPPPQK